jgi:bleomycin hydrolase
LLAPATAVAQTTPQNADFTIEIDLERMPVLSQDSTGTCWSYATTSFLEAEVLRINGERVDLSEMYLVRCAYERKASTYVRLGGNAQFSQGGLSHDVIAMARLHGLMPQNAFTGLLPGQTRHDHGEMESALKALLDVYSKSKRPSPQWPAAIDGVLDAYLGEVPERFTWQGESHDARSFAQRVAKLPLDEYVELMSFESDGFGQRAELLVPDNWMRYAGYWNMPVDELLSNIDNALDKGFSLALDCDVSERGANARAGLFELPGALEQRSIPDALRQQMFDNRETTDDHLMHIVGRARHEDGRTFYIVKNSWGEIGPFKGNLMMSRNYLALKTLAVMVHKDGLLPDTVARFASAAPR